MARGRGAGVVIVEKLQPGDGQVYPIRLDKHSGEFTVDSPHPDEARLVNKDLAKLKADFKQKYAEKISVNYELVIALSSSFVYRSNPEDPRENGARLDDFNFDAAWLWWRGLSTPRGLKAEFWDGKTMFVNNTPIWTSEPSGPDDQVRRRPQSAYVGKEQIFFPYTWERWVALTKIEDRINLLKKQVEEFFLREDFVERLDSGTTPLLTGGPVKKPGK
jgi:hypothetical protein